MKTNQTRAAAGLPPLVRDSGLDAMAGDWSNHMAGVFAANGGQVIDPAAPTDCNRSALCHRPDLGPALSSSTRVAQRRREHRRRRRRRRASRTPSSSRPATTPTSSATTTGSASAWSRQPTTIWVTLDFMERPAARRLHRHRHRRPDRLRPGRRRRDVAVEPGRFTPAQPQRLLDTRSGSPLGGGTSMTLKVAGVGRCPPTPSAWSSTSPPPARRDRLPDRVPVRGDAADGVERQLRGRVQRAQPGRPPWATAGSCACSPTWAPT